MVKWCVLDHVVTVNGKTLEVGHENALTLVIDEFYRVVRVIAIRVAVAIHDIARVMNVVIHGVAYVPETGVIRVVPKDVVRVVVLGSVRIIGLGNALVVV